MIGAYTLLKLCRCTGEKKTEDYVEAVIRSYQELLKKCEEDQIAWIQFDEPSLVQDMTKEDVALFHKLYESILPSAADVDALSCHVLLQTYFGDVRDIYADLLQMPFSGIGLDFIEGRESYHLIEKYGFPQDKLLFAGLVNGKNIWKNHYKKPCGFWMNYIKREFLPYFPPPVPCYMYHILSNIRIN